MSGQIGEMRNAVRLEALGLMTAGIVHDLGNMVQQMQSAVRLIARHPKVQATEGLEPIIAGATMSMEQAGALIHQLLAFARNDGGVREPVDVPLCLARLEPLLRWICGSDVKLTMVIAVNLPRLLCSRRSLENALLNLVLNARDATPAGGKIVVCGRTRTDPVIGDCVSLSVADTGAGMEAEIAARAFEPFFTTKVAGTGLGLPMVARFAQECGGYAAIESQPGEGTVVSLHLPATGIE